MYNTISKPDFINLIANRLGDTQKVYWTEAETNRITDECLLTFAAISGYWKDKILIESKNGQQLYDLTNSVDIKSGLGLVNTLKYQDIINWLDDNLVDYSQLIDTIDIIPLITEAINNFQSETKLVLNAEQYSINVNEAINISEDVLDIIAAYYIDSSGVYYALQRADENGIALLKNDYTLTPNRPRFYSINGLSTHKIDIFPRPSENGFLELVYVIGKTGEQTVDSTCLIPNNLVPYLKYKVAGDILDKDDNADPFRAAYCKQRWNEGLIVGKNYAAIINTKLNGINKVPASILDFDKLRYGWRNDEVIKSGDTITKGINAIALAGYNIFGFNRIPGVDVYSALLECIINAPIDEEDIDIRVDYISVLIDYCVHLAMFKDGIASLQKTQSHLEKFIRIAASHNEYLQTRRISYLDLLQKSKYPIKQTRLFKEEESAA